MASSARFRVADVCSVLGVRKHEVRAWLRLPPYEDAPVEARIARKFDQTELVFFALIAQLHIEFGMSPRAVRRFSVALHRLVMSNLEPHKVIQIDVAHGTATYLGVNVPRDSGVFLAVAPSIERVQSFLLGELPPVGSVDRNVLRLDRRTKA